MAVYLSKMAATMIGPNLVSSQSLICCFDELISKKSVHADRITSAFMNGNRTQNEGCAMNWERAVFLAFRLCCFTLCSLNCPCSFPIWASPRDSLSSWFATRQDTNRPVQPQKLARVFKLYYPGSEQQRRWSDCADAQADLHLCCPHMAKTGFLMTRLIWCLGQDVKFDVSVPDHCLFIFAQCKSNGTAPEVDAQT